jgi:exodeoxyribonuclease VII small subunit
MAKVKSSKDTNEYGTFEEAFDELQQLVQGIESGKLNLNESIEKFEKGVRLAAYCRKRLEDAEAKIEQLTKDNKLESFTKE